MSISQTPLKEVPRLLSVLGATVLGLHVHIDRPDVHPFGVVGHDAFEHSAPALGLAVLEFKHAVFRDQVHVLFLR